MLVAQGREGLSHVVSSLCAEKNPFILSAITFSLPVHHNTKHHLDQHDLLQDDTVHRAAIQSTSSANEPLSHVNLESGGNPRNTSPTTGLPLNPEMVKKGRELEMQYMELKVLEDSDRDACMAEMGRPPIPTDWVDWSVKRHVDGQHLMWKIGQRRSLRLLRTKLSNCS